MHFARLGHIPAAEPQAHAAPDGFVHSFVEEIAVAPGAATISHTIPMPKDSPLRGGKAEEVPLGTSVLPTVKLGRKWWTYAYCTANFPLGGQPVGESRANPIRTR